QERSGQSSRDSTNQHVPARGQQPAPGKRRGGCHDPGPERSFATRKADKDRGKESYHHRIERQGGGVYQSARERGAEECACDPGQPHCSTAADKNTYILLALQPPLERVGPVRVTDERSRCVTTSRRHALQP